MKVVSVIWAILRGLLWALADEFPLGGRKRPAAEKKESPWWAERPEAERPTDPPAAEPRAEAPAPDKPAAPSWWPEPAPPTTPPTIKVETDAGTFIASTTFSGPHCMGVKRIERPRQEGESRRRRRAGRPASPVTPADVAAELREPEVPTDATVGAASPATRTDVELQPTEPAVPQPTQVEAAPAEGAAMPIDPSEAPRVARARRVRGRFGAADQPGSNLLATTLATRLALSASTCGSPGASTAARNGVSA